MYIIHNNTYIYNTYILLKNLLREEWGTIRTLADNRSIVIKKADKGSCIVVRDRAGYLRETEN